MKESVIEDDDVLTGVTRGDREGDVNIPLLGDLAPGLSKQ